MVLNVLVIWYFVVMVCCACGFVVCGWLCCLWRLVWLAIYDLLACLVVCYLLWLGLLFLELGLFWLC